MLNCKDFGGLSVVLDGVCKKSWHRYQPYSQILKNWNFFLPTLDITEKNCSFSMLYDKILNFSSQWTFLQEKVEGGDNNIDHNPLPKN